MYQKTIIVLICVWALICSQALASENSTENSTKNSNAVQDIDKSFQAAFGFVKDNELEAPEASRIYVLTAIALHDVHALSKFESPYLNYEDISKQTRRLIEFETVISNLLIANSSNLNSDFNFENFTREDSSENLAFFISSQLPKPKVSKFENFGSWVSNNLKPVSPEWKYSKLLELKSASQFRPLGPPDINSETFIRDKNETALYGGEFSDIRGSDKSFTARLWMGAAGSVTSPGHWNRIALSETRNLETAQRLDVLLALNIAMYDAGVAAWDAKYHYNFLRPKTAINLDGPEYIWRPMAETPRHPEYVSGHSTFSGAAATILMETLGEYRFCAVFEEAWKQERCFENFWAAAQEAGRSRIYGGLHFEFSNQDGLTLGRSVASHVLRALEE